MARRTNKYQNEDTHRTSSPQPPPPYEVAYIDQPQSSRVTIVSVNQQQEETIPKLTIMQTMDTTTNIDNHHHNHNYDNPCLRSNDEMSSHVAATRNGAQHEPRRGKPTSGAEQHEQFVESLTQSRGFFNNISVEPVAFIAMLAMYIEFPAIQDLIYTKICLEVVGRHPILPSNHSYPAGVWSGNLQSNTSLYSAAPQQPGRILGQQTGGGGGAIESVDNLIRPSTLINSYQPSRDHYLCNKVNRTLIPKELREEILDIDSLFWLKYQIIVCTLCALTSPYWGGVSDKIGRIIPLNVSIGGDALCNIISLIFGLLISLNSHALFHLNWLYVGAIVVGLSGGQSVLITNLFGFISDNTTSEERTKRVTVLEATICVSHSFGFFLNRLIMSLGLANQDKFYLNRHFVAFSISTLLNMICILLSITRLRHHKFHRFLNNFEREQQEAASIGPINCDEISDNSTESLGRMSDNKKNKKKKKGQGGHQDQTAPTNTGERMRELTSSTPDDLDGSPGRLNKSESVWSALTTFKYYRQTYEAATKPREARSIILLLLLSGFISAMSLTTLMSLLYIYLKMDPFNWTTSQYSTWNSWTSITRGLAMVGLSLCMRSMPNWNVPDPLVASIGFLSKGAGLLMIGLAPSSAIINWALLALVFSEYSMPPIRSLLSKLVVRDELGKIYSCFGLLQSICFIFGNIVFYIALKSIGGQEFYRLSFIVVAAIEFGSVIIMLLIYSSLRHRVLVT